MPKTTPEGVFPFNKNKFTVTLFEMGNAPDYSTVYNIGVQAARGVSEGYTINNAPKKDPLNYIEVTGNNGSDIMKYNYMKIDYGNTGDGVKWYFITSKNILNYPDLENGQQGWYAVGFNLKLDVWETYKNKIGSPNIHLSQVTTSAPGAWSDTSMLESDIVPFSGVDYKSTATRYVNWKNVIGWQAKKPNEQDNFVIDGMRTTMQFNSSGDLDDFKNDLDKLITEPPEATNIFRSYIVCNSYIVSDYFATSNGGKSQVEKLTLANPSTSQVHKRLDYYPYKRAFIQTIDGQQVEIDYKKFLDNKLPSTISATVNHSLLPQPTSTIRVDYSDNVMSDYIVFNAYPTIDIAGRNITHVTQLFSEGQETFAYQSKLRGF